MSSNYFHNRLIFGTGSLHHLFNCKTRQKVIGKAFDFGFRCFDTAPSYGNGIDESELGLALKGKRHLCQINTKYGIPIPIYNDFARYIFHVYRGIDILLRKSARDYLKRNFSISELENSLNSSLKRLLTDHVDCLFIHEPIFHLSEDEIKEIIYGAEKLIQIGKIRYFGVAGIYSSIKMCSSLESFDVVQTRIQEVDLIRNIENSKIIAYGLYRDFIEQSNKMNFNQFIMETLNKKKDIKLILSTISINKLESMRDLF